jgi:hypothetical protein
MLMPTPWYKENPFWGAISGFVAFTLAGVGFVVTGNPILGRWLFWLASPWALMALWLAIYGTIKNTGWRVGGLVAAIILVVSVFWFADRFWIHPKPLMSLTKTEPAPATATHDIAKDVHKKQRPQPPSTPCTLRGGTFYPEVRDMPGGAKLDRPAFELENVVPFSVWYWEGDKYWLFLEFAITNRGEESIVKGWELCLERDHKPLMYQPAAVPQKGVTLPNGETITANQTLTESAIKNPIPHGHRVVGWVAFSIPKDVAQEYMKTLPRGSIRLKDYLAHTYSYDFTPGSIPGNIDVYVPGQAQKP